MKSAFGLTDVDRWSAPVGGSTRALRLGIGLAAIALLTTPFAGVMLAPSYPLIAMLLAASIMGTAITALLLLVQARAMRSLPSAVLGTGFAYAAATMVPYTFLNHGMFPGLAEALGADPIGHKYLWFSWQAGLLIAMLAYQRLRRAESGAQTRVRGKAVIAGLAIGYAIVTPLAIWTPNLPALSNGTQFAPLFAFAFAPATLALAALVIVESMRRRRRASVLDAWIALVALSVIVEIYLTVVSTTAFTVGWYAARVVLLFSTTVMLTVQLAQATRLYADLVDRAEELESEAHTDTLTNLPNRRRFDEEFARAFGSAIRRGSPISVAIVDIDRFKNYNDAFGHQAGDAALKTIAGAIAESVGRSGDFAARYGGEEFVVILEETTLGGAADVAERIRLAVLETAIDASGGGPLTVSVGVAARLPGSNREALLRQADAALYEAKNAGRNRVARWHSGAVAPIGSAFDVTHEPAGDAPPDGAV